MARIVSLAIRSLIRYLTSFAPTLFSLPKASADGYCILPLTNLQAEIRSLSILVDTLQIRQ
jgi:hypothetical protein